MKLDTTPLTNSRKFVVGDKIFYNNIDALEYFTQHPSSKMYFDLGYNFIYNTQLWNNEPPDTIENYLREHAKYIASQYDDIVLLYSGGTDSHTMLMAFISEGIKNVRLVHEDESIYRTADEPKNSKDQFYTPPLIKELFQKYGKKLNELNYKVINTIIYHYADKICTYDLYDKVLADKNYGDYNGNIKTVFKWLNYLSPHVTTIPKKGKKSCIVIGREKPMLNLSTDLKNWVWQLNSTIMIDLYLRLQDDNVDVLDFYFSDVIPEIQIKLSWLKLHALEKIIKIENLPLTKETVSRLQQPTSKFYTIINSSMGYQGLNSYTTSNMTKKQLEPTCLISPTQSFVSAAKKNNVDNLLQEHYEEATKNIRKEYIQPGNKVSGILSIPVPLKPINNFC